MTQKQLHLPLINAPPLIQTNSEFKCLNLYKTMKTIKLIFTITFLSFLTSNAQITKGNWMVGGNASFSNKELYNNNFSNAKRKTTEIEINANTGYFFIDKLQAGARVGYSSYKIKNSDSDSNRYWLKYGLYSRYYFLKSEKIVNIFIDGEYFFGNSAFSNGEFKDNLNGYVFSAGPTIFFNSSVAMEFGINYSSTKFKGVNDSTENNFQFSLGFQIFLEKN